jgi:hypothetical protein
MTGFAGPVVETVGGVGAKVVDMQRRPAKGAIVTLRAISAQIYIRYLLMRSGSGIAALNTIRRPAERYVYESL